MAEFTSEDRNETGGSLREKLEAALAQNAQLATEVASVRAEKLIAAKEFQFVTPEDLKGVKLDELEARATALEAAGAKTAEAALRRLFEKQGLDGDSLDAAVKDAIGPKTDEADAAAAARVRAAANVAGTTPTTVSAQNLTAEQKIAAGIAAERKGRRK